MILAQESTTTMPAYGNQNDALISDSNCISYKEDRIDSNENIDGSRYDEVNEKTPLISVSGDHNVISYTTDGDTLIRSDGNIRYIDQTGEESQQGNVKFTSRREDRLWRVARILGYISAGLLIALGAICFFEASRSDSSSVFAFAFSCLLDSSGAVVVIWRSFSTESAEKSRIRELQAQLIIGCLFWFAALFILVRAMMYLNDLDDQEEEESQFLYILLGIGCGLQLFFFLTKTPIAFVLKSSALIADGVNSLAACVLAVMGIVASVLGNSYERLDIIDDVVGVVVSFFIAGYGTYLLFRVWVDPYAAEVFHIPQAPCTKRTTPTADVTV